VKGAVEQAQDLLQAQLALAQTLEEDRVYGEKQVQAASGDGAVSQSTNALNACGDLEGRRLHHETSELPMLSKNDKKLLQLQQQVAGVHNKLSLLLVERLRVVSELQSQIRYLGNRLAMLKENAVAQEVAVSELLHVRCMPSAYAACVEEVKMRQQYFRTYVAKVRFIVPWCVCSG